MKARLAAVSVAMVLAACGIKGAPRPVRKPPPKEQPPAPVTPLPAREATTTGMLVDAGMNTPFDAGVPDAGSLAAAADAGTSLDGGR